MGREPTQNSIQWALLFVLALGLVFPSPCRAVFPYELESGQEAGLVLAAAAAFGAGWWLDRDFRPLIPEEVGALDPRSLNGVDRPATRRWSRRAAGLSDWLVTGQMGAPMALPFTSNGSREPLTVSAMYLETMALNTGLTYLLKNTFNRPRPLVYNAHPDISSELKTSRFARKSFPSGHTANAFAAMVMLASVNEQLHPDGKHNGKVWAGCLASAALTGVLRVTSGRHFATDVLAGAALGALVGYTVPRLHEVDSSPVPGNSKQSVSISFRMGF